MDNKLISPRFMVLVSIIFAGAAMRLLPHWPNFTPIAAIALFGGAYFGKKYLAYLVPIVAMFLSDLIIGLHQSMLAVYLSFIVTVWIGQQIAKKPNWLNIAGASLASSILFFLVTNFSAWLVSPFYSKDFIGLMQSYTAGLVFFNNGTYGISFFINSVLGDMFYNTIFFGVFYLASLRFRVLAKN